MNEVFVTKETALLAKQKGFNLPTLYGLNENLEHVEYYTYESYSPGEPEVRINDFINEWFIQIPSQSVLQKWLREIHNIDIIPPIKMGNDGYICQLVRTDNMKCFSTYEEALEFELQKKLKLL